MKKVAVLAGGCVLAFVAAGAVSYTPVDYITVDKQYVKTGVVFSDSTTAEVEMRFSFDLVSGNQALWCSRATKTSRNFVTRIQGNNKHFHIGYGTTELQEASATVTAEANKIYIVHQKGNVLTVSDDEGELLSYTLEGQSAFTPSGELILFETYDNGTKPDSNRSNQACISFYSCKVWDNGTLVRDYTPVLKTETASGKTTYTHGLYDKKNSSFTPAANKPGFHELAVWNGPDGGDLAVSDNWTYPILTAKTMKFIAQPSKDYTVTLADDFTFPGTWGVDQGPYRVNFDLGGHTLTFNTAYTDSNHANVTNTLVNGTIAFVDGVTTNECRHWHANSGYTMDIGAGGKLIANFRYTDAGTKHLYIHDGGVLAGRIESCGADCDTVITGTGSTFDGGSWGSLEIGGTGPGASLTVVDGGAVTNVKMLALGGTGGGDAKVMVSNAVFHMISATKDGTIQIGKSSNNCRFDAVDGAQVQLGATAKAICAVGDVGGNSNTLYVAGEKTKFSMVGLDADGYLNAGQNGSYNQIVFTDQATADVPYLAAGGQRKGQGNNVVTCVCNRVTIEKGAKVTSTNLAVAQRHSDDKNKATYLTSTICSNVFEVIDGGIVEASALYCGTVRPSFHNVFRVSGEGSTATFSGKELNVGSHGSWGNLLEVVNGGSLVATGDINIGSSTKVPGCSNNVVRLDGCVFTTSLKTINIGGYTNANNRLWIGTGSDITYSAVYFRGFGSELLLSNGTLRVASNLNCQEGQDYQSCGSRFTFVGESPSLLISGGNGGSFKRGSILRFVPAGSGECWTTAPLTSSNVKLNFDDDTEFEFDFSAIGQEGCKAKLIETTSASKVLGISDALVAKADAAAKAAWPRAKVTLSDNKKVLSLKLPRQGLMILFR